jgi:hypothetical protein
MRGLFCNKLFKKCNDPKFGWFPLCSDFGQFLTGPSSDHGPPTKMAGPPMETSFHLLQYTPDILSFGLNALKKIFLTLNFTFFPPSRFLNWHFVLTDFLQWIPCVKGHPVYSPENSGDHWSAHISSSSAVDTCMASSSLILYHFIQMALL